MTGAPHAPDFSPDEWLDKCITDMADSHIASLAGPHFRDRVARNEGTLPPDAIPRLFNLLDIDDRSAEQAVLSLVALGMPALVAMVAELDSPNPDRQSNALYAIEQFGPDAALATARVEPMLDSEHPDVRSQAAMVLRRLNPDRTELEPLVLDAIEGPYRNTYFRALRHLDALPEILPHLLPRFANIMATTCDGSLVQLLKKMPGPMPPEVIDALKVVAAGTPEQHTLRQWAREQAQEMLRTLNVDPDHRT